MAINTVTYNTKFLQWKDITNNIITAIGDNDNLNTTATDLVSAVNEVISETLDLATYDPGSIAEQLVGLTATQTLTNKTLTSPTINNPTLTLTQSATPAPTGNGVIEWDNDSFKLAIGDGTSTKVFSDDSITSGIHGITGDFVGTTDTQTLTNKTLTSPTINNPTLTLTQSTAPSPTSNGVIEWDNDSFKLAIGDGTGTKVFSDDIYVLSRSNHTGTQTASTISDFDSAVSGNTDVSANTSARHTHSNSTNLASIDQNLATTDTVTFNEVIESEVTTGISAAGIDQSGATSISARVNVVSTATAASAEGVKLPAATGSMAKITIINADGTDTIKIYPASGDDLGQGSNISRDLLTGDGITFVDYATNTWGQV